MRVRINISTLTQLLTSSSGQMPVLSRVVEVI